MHHHFRANLGEFATDESSQVLRAGTDHDHFSFHCICVYSISRKRSKAVQKMISHNSQHSFSIGALGENTDYRHGTRHRTKNDAKVLLSLCCRRSRHELHPLSRPIFHQAGNSFPDSEFGASNLRRQRRNRAVGIGMIKVLG
jgi:hypothetical protein